MIPSALEIPSHAEPLWPCLCFLPHRGGTRFSVQIIDLATGDVLEGLPPQEICELPGVLDEMARWVFRR